MSFVNTLPYISNPIEEFRNFKFVKWEKEIYPALRGETKKEEIDFYSDLIIKNKLKNIIDIGVGGGSELNSILKSLKSKKYGLESAEANEVDEEFISQADELFKKEKQRIIVHKANWIDL